MDFVSAIEEASRDHEAEARETRLVAASTEAQQIWPFLALASSQKEFEHRLALREDRLTSIASKHGVSLDEVVGPLQRGFEALLVTAAIECGTCGHSNGPHTQGAACSSCGCTAFKPKSHFAAKSEDPDEGQRFWCTNCDGAGHLFDLVGGKGLHACPDCQGSGSLYRKRRADSDGGYSKKDFDFSPAPKREASKTAAVGNPDCETGYGTDDASACACPSCLEKSPPKAGHEVTGPTIDSTRGYEYKPAPEHVQRACQRRFEGGGATAIHPEKPGYYLHGVGNWWDGPSEVKDEGDGTLSYTNPYTKETDRFNEHGYFTTKTFKGGNPFEGDDVWEHHAPIHKPWGNPHEGSRKTGYAAHIDNLRTALMEGQDPLQWIVEQNPPGGPQYAEVNNGHDTVQEFVGPDSGNQNARDQALHQGSLSQEGGGPF